MITNQEIIVKPKKPYKKPRMVYPKSEDFSFKP